MDGVGCRVPALEIERGRRKDWAKAKLPGGCPLIWGIGAPFPQRTAPGPLPPFFLPFPSRRRLQPLMQWKGPGEARLVRQVTWAQGIAAARGCGGGTLVACSLLTQVPQTPDPRPQILGLPHLSSSAPPAFQVGGFCDLQFHRWLVCGIGGLSWIAGTGSAFLQIKNWPLRRHDRRIEPCPFPDPFLLSMRSLGDGRRMKEKVPRRRTPSLHRRLSEDLCPGPLRCIPGTFGRLLP
jgi:hypothetical protein